MTSTRENARKRLAILEVEEMEALESLEKNISDIYEVVKVTRNIHKEIRDAKGQAVVHDERLKECRETLARTREEKNLRRDSTDWRDHSCQASAVGQTENHKKKIAGNGAEATAEAKVLQAQHARRESLDQETA